MFGGYEAVAGIFEAGETFVVGHGAVSQAAAARSSCNNNSAPPLAPFAHTLSQSHGVQKQRRATCHFFSVIVFSGSEGVSKNVLKLFVVRPKARPFFFDSCCYDGT